ncbi:MAG: hypothetical protein ACRDXC_08065, partial [Acidimicrobiales bacterium]
QAVFATETLSLGINMPARTVAIERFDKYGSAGRAPLTSGEYAQLTGRAGRRGLDEVGHAVVLWSFDTQVADMARIAVAPPPDLRSAFRPTYNLAVNLVRRFDRPTALTVLRRSFAQWQADLLASRTATRSATRTKGGEGGAERHEGQRDLLVDHLGRRLAVLEELGYVDDWTLTARGTRLSRVYHDCDLLAAAALAEDVLADAEPSVLAGVLSSLVFERRRARRPLATPGRARRGAAHDSSRPKRRGVGGGDRLGEGRRREIADRLAELDRIAGSIRAVEEIHLVTRTREPEHGLASAVASWARGASFGTVLEVAYEDAGEIAPGDFVRTVKQLVDLVGQVATVAGDQSTAAAAEAAMHLLRRDVVAAASTPSLSD